MSHEPGRVMALDVGSKRIGVALTDTLRLLASPLTTIRAQPREAAFERITTLIGQNEVVELVIGLPISLNGNVGPQAEIVKRFAAELESRIQVPIHFFDERYTSSEAERVMIEMGLKAEQRKARIDEMAASIILRDYIDAQRTRRAYEARDE